MSADDFRDQIKKLDERLSELNRERAQRAVEDAELSRKLDERLSERLTELSRERAQRAVDDAQLRTTYVTQLQELRSQLYYTEAAIRRERHEARTWTYKRAAPDSLSSESESSASDDSGPSTRAASRCFGSYKKKRVPVPAADSSPEAPGLERVAADADATQATFSSTSSNQARTRSAPLTRSPSAAKM